MLRTRFRTRARFIPALSGGGAFSITNSLRFNDDDSAYLSRTPSVAGNRKTWTWSGWVKLGNSGATRTLFAARLATSNSDSLQVYLTSNDQIDVGGVSYGITATPVLRDPSGWYHIVLSYDTTQATDTNRAKIYINGIQASVTGTYPSINLDTPINNTQAHNLGRRPTENDRYFDGYMAEVNFIDGQALTADDFGQIDATTGEWSPKKYSGTYGTNGFYLPLNGNANDSSGNGNNWTENNLASTDYMIDTPTNNFSVLNPLDKDAAIILSEGNLKTSLSSPPGGDVIAYGTVGVSSGKWYMETTLNDFSYPLNGAAGIFGMHDGSNRVGAAYSTGITSWYAYSEGAFTALSFNGSAIGMVMQIAIDLDAGKLWVGKDGVWNGSGDPDTGANPDRTFTPSGTYKMSAEPYRDGVGYWLLTVNAGADSSFAGVKTRQGNTDANGIGDFYYTPPTGYLALCTDNLPAPAIEQPENHFNVVTYTGNGGTQSITGVGFQPDFVWAKLRTTSSYHRLHDVVRGSDNTLASNVGDAEVAGNGIVSFDSDGFTMDSGTNINQPYPYVAWCWKAGGTAVTNTDGSITSQVSANVDAGFSIVGYTGTSGTDTIGHGLNAEPELIIAKVRGIADSWPVYHKDTTGDGFLFLDSTAAFFSSAGYWGTPNSSTFGVSGTGTRANNRSGQTHIAYCFHSVEGFSKFGSYVGNGSADGPFVYTGFKPAFVMTKRTDSTSNWAIVDNERIGYNIDNKLIYPNLSNAESTGGVTMDLLSNGFKPRYSGADYNASGGTYIYMAFAEAPFKNSVAR